MDVLYKFNLLGDQLEEQLNDKSLKKNHGFHFFQKVQLISSQYNSFDASKWSVRPPCFVMPPAGFSTSNCFEALIPAWAVDRIKHHQTDVSVEVCNPNSSVLVTPHHRSRGRLFFKSKFF